jgi:hypothetical protein
LAECEARYEFLGGGAQIAKEKLAQELAGAAF